jgi:hypothetical protein
MAVLLVSMDLFALATVPAGPDEAGGPPPTKFYRRRDNVGEVVQSQEQRCGGRGIAVTYRLLVVDAEGRVDVEPPLPRPIAGGVAELR